MTTVLNSKATQLLRRAAVRAAMAPSLHNAQPWRFVLRGDAMEIHADRSRQLRVLDPLGRQLMLGCGCALFNARVSLAASGYEAEVQRFPDPADRDLVARLTPAPGIAADVRALAALDPVIELRQTNRRAFDDESVPAEVVDTLVVAAAAEGAQLYPIVRPEDRLATAMLSQQADQLENADPAYRAELRAWTTDDPRRSDGVPAMAVPHVDAGSGDEVPIRDFDTRGTGWLPTRTHSTMDQCLLLLGADADDPVAWLRAGEALERVLLEITRHDYAVSPLTQVIEVARTNERLRQELGLTMHPHVLLRVGRAPSTPKVRRRRLVDMLVEEE
jgi:nitroreductase